MVVSVIEITTIALLVMVGRTVPLMGRMIRHDAIVRKGRVGGRKYGGCVMAIQSFRDLVAWQRAIDLAEGIYHVTYDWPAEERFGLTSQIRRAAVSVMANIAEGQGRTGSGEFLHHLSIADGSLSEVEAHLLFAHRLRFIDEATLDGLLQNLQRTRSPLRGLIQRLR
jgi:four helix bundle protein